jgi:hypothetical protein
MKKIKSTDFYREWINSVTNRKEEMIKIWEDNEKFTEFVKGSENSIITQISNKLGLLSYEQDYYSIDTILYTKEDLTPRIKENTFWFRDIKVAFEHENNVKSGLYQELSHLLITNCELKVLVAYPNDSDEELPYLHEIIKGSRHSKEISDKENFLIIFGYENGFEWEGYIYKEDKWTKI